MRFRIHSFSCLLAYSLGNAAGQDADSGQQRGSWLGWGADVFNNRLAAPGSPIDSCNAASLVETCSKIYPVGVSATPVIQKGIAYYPTWSGLYVALDYTTCKEIWTVNVTALTLANGGPPPFNFSSIAKLSRTSAVLDGDVVYFGTQAHALLIAVDRHTGNVLDHVQINSHPYALLTQSPTLWNHIIYIGSSSAEESAAAYIPDYHCCSFIGNFAAVEFDQGSHKFKVLWQQTMAPISSNFTGIGVWGGQPSIDARRHQVFIATGNIYFLPESASKCENETQNNPDSKHDPCVPSNVYAEAVLALDLTSGHVNWATALGPLDAWNVACTTGTEPSNCPPSPGPDADFGMAPSFVPGGKGTPQGKDTVVVGQKNGNLYAFDAESGALFWVNPTSPDGIVGGLIWGLAVDGTAIYYTAVNYGRVTFRPTGASANITNSAFGAANLADGKSLWQTPVPGNGYSQSVPSVVNDVVFNGRSGVFPTKPGGSPSGPGGLVAMDKKTGAILHDYPLDHIFYANIAIVDEYLMFGTGYPVSTDNGAFHVWQLRESEKTWNCTKRRR